MKKLIALGFAIVLICFSCQSKEETSNVVSITGQIENHNLTVLKFQDILGKGKWNKNSDMVYVNSSVTTAGFEGKIRK